MITLLASIAGFISSIVPEFIKYFKDINDKKHELNILDRQIQYNKVNASKTLEEMGFSEEERDSAIRISLGYTTTNQDIDKFLRISMNSSIVCCFLREKFLRNKSTDRGSFVSSLRNHSW